MTAMSYKQNVFLQKFYSGGLSLYNEIFWLAWRKIYKTGHGLTCHREWIMMDLTWNKIFEKEYTK